MRGQEMNKTNKILVIDDESPLILMVDDNLANLQVLVALLEKKYKTAIAKDGFKALEFAKKKRPDLILLDIMMPDMDGFEVCAKLKESPETRDIPIIFLTAKVETEDVVKGFDLGAVDYVTKPFRRKELLARVKTHVKLKRAEDLLKQGLAEAQHLARMGSWVWNIQNNIFTWSDEIYHIFGLTSREFGTTSEAFLNFVHPDDREFVIQSVDAALYKQKPYSIDHRIVLPDGNELIVHEEAEVTFDDTGTPVRMLGTVQDITEKKRIEAELRKLSMAIEESINLVVIMDAEGTIEYVNPMFERVTGYSREEIIGQNPRILASGEIPKIEYKGLWNIIKAGKTWQGEFKNKKKNGEFYWVKGLISPIKNEEGTITHFLAIQEDISGKMLAEEKARYLSTYDRTTGLLNRERFIEILAEQVSGRKHGTLILADIDGFKLINEVYGHNMADEFLKSLSRLITETVEDIAASEQYIIGRLGEDEIAIAVPEKNGKEGWSIAEQIRKKVEAFKFSGESIRTTISAGIVECPKHGETTKELLSRVDAAVFRAKGLGKNRCHLFSPDDRDIENIHSRLRQKERIIRALEEDRLEPWFQPILDLRDNQIHHYEALARMRGEDGNIVLPGAFISISEALGLIDAIDRTVTSKTIRYQAHLRQRGHDLSFAMNISGKHLGNEDLLDFLKTTIGESGAEPGRLVFEITETAAIRDLEQAIRFINALKAMGCCFALDDFGVGFTSFVYLREMNVDFIKIDGTFIRELHEHKHDQGIVKAITTVARDMEIKTIAEFVEQEGTIPFLKEFGVDYAQGFLIGKPTPAPNV